jgi:FMN-dependent oxidoreductase (nitrilotriacetate monooxygenase family)
MTAPGRPAATDGDHTVTKRQLKLGLVPMGAGGPGASNRWLDTDIPTNASVNIDWYIDAARQAEAAKFDLVFIVDSQFITKNSPPHYLNRLEPLTLLSALAVSTSHIGLVGTLTTSYNDPFNLARRLASLDLISRGRAGWNVVTSGDAGTAGNYSQDAHFDYDTRYARAVEFLDVARGLWRSYEEDAFVRDRATGQFLDDTKLHALNHVGEFFSVVGPLNIERSPQGEPVIFQAGDSDLGRDLGANIADAIFTHAASIEQGQAFYTDLKGRAAKRGRNPDEIVILPGFTVYVGDTDADAKEVERHYRALDQSFEQSLAEFGRSFGWHDFRQYDLDAPFPGPGARIREEQLLHRVEAHHRSRGFEKPDVAPDDRVHPRLAKQPVRRLARNRRQRNHPLVRRPCAGRPQRPSRPPQPVRPLHPRGRADLAGARRLPDGL